MQSARRDCAFLDNEYVESFAQFDAEDETQQRFDAVTMSMNEVEVLTTEASMISSATQIDSAATGSQSYTADTAGYSTMALEMQRKNEDDWARPVFV